MKKIDLEEGNPPRKKEGPRLVSGVLSDWEYPGFLGLYSLTMVVTH